MSRTKEKTAKVSLAGALLLGGCFRVGPTPCLNRQFDEPERQIVRLPPAAFPDLPRNLVGELERRGCRIPQEEFSKKPNNVIKGEFARPGEVDWAVLCSIKDVWTILVFWYGSEMKPVAIAPMEDWIPLQGITLRKSDFPKVSVPWERTSTRGTTTLRTTHL
jgi:hypothetical protein